VSDPTRGPEDLGELEGLPHDDPRLHALESQPRVRAQRRAYQDFVTPGDEPAGARPAEAAARLRETLERELGVAIDERSDPTRAPSERGARGQRRVQPGWLDRLFGAPWQPLGVAALLVVAGGLWLLSSSRHESAPVFRGGTRVEGWSALPAQRQSDGSVRLQWPASPGAARYAVVFLSADLREIARLEDLSTTRIDLRPGRLPVGLESGSHVLWRVVALSGADEVARSGLQPLIVP
jgi:hypothetical protein